MEGSMVGLILRTGLFNTTLLVAIAGLVWAAWPRAVGRVTRLTARSLLVALAAGTAFNLFIGLYRSYTVPRDVLQDIISAREFAAGRPMEPGNMNELARQALADEGPRRSLLTWSPDLAAREREQFDVMLAEHWVQAHPPFLTLVTVPLVRTFGVLGTQAAFAALALTSLGLTLFLIRRELWPDGEWAMLVAAALAVYGWAPVVSVVRLQQPGLILIALLTLSWAWLRRGRELKAGAAVAVAAALKVIPGLLVVPLLARHRRGFAAAAVTLSAVALFVVAEVPLRDLVDYRATASGVVDEYATYNTNISLLGMFARIAKASGLPLVTAKVGWEVSGGLMVVAWLWAMIRRPTGDQRADVDREFAVGLSLLPLLSPVAWDHYDAFLILPLAVLAHRLRWGGAGRRAWAGFWAVVAVLSVPDPAYLAAYEAAQSAGWAGLEVGVLEPLRTLTGLALVAWLLRLPAVPAAATEPAVSPEPVLAPAPA